MIIAGFGRVLLFGFAGSGFRFSFDYDRALGFIYCGVVEIEIV